MSFESLVKWRLGLIDAGCCRHCAQFFATWASAWERPHDGVPRMPCIREKLTAPCDEKAREFVRRVGRGYADKVA